MTLQQAIQLHQAGQFPQAETIYRQLLAQDPNNHQLYHLLGAVAGQTGRIDEALQLIQRALALKPNEPLYVANLASALREKGRLDEAIAAFRSVLAVQPNNIIALNNLANTLMTQNKLDEAILHLQKVVQLQPNMAVLHNNLGNAYLIQGRFTQAVAAYREGLRLDPRQSDICNNLGYALKDAGQLDDAIASFRQALAINPKNTIAHSNLIFTLHFHPDVTAAMIHAETRRWNAAHAAPLASTIQPHTNNRDPHRRLRIGYVSPDLCNHPVGRFMLPLLSSHDPKAVEIFCYASVVLPDQLTTQLRSHTHTWRNTLGLTDEALANQIRADQIDLLVDLAMHTRGRASTGSLLLAFARKPAPVQLTYLAFLSSTGLDAIDYRFSDPYIDPPDSDTSCYSETTIRLPESYWCYAPPSTTIPPVNALPALSKGHITFGALNTYSKCSTKALETWSKILHALPTAHLILHANADSHRQNAAAAFSSQGIAATRYSFFSFAPMSQYFQQYSRIDIALDPFPYAGGTTTCDALYMGVPVITLRGQTAAGRGGVSILHNLHLPELVAETPDQYIPIATTLAQDLPKLQSLRATLRARMQSSPLMNAQRFAKNIEAAYRHMWQTWCAKSPPNPPSP